MNTLLWSSAPKIQWRLDTLPTQVQNQYWTLAGDCSGDDNEVDHILQYIDPSQFHGVDRDLTVVRRNREKYPHLKWHHGDFYHVMRQFRGFNPGFVNADLVQTVDTAAPLILSIIDLVKSFQCGVNFNIVLGPRNKPPQSTQHVINMLTSKTLRRAERMGWAFEPQCYEYKNRTSTMGTFFWRRKAMRVAA